MHTEVCALYRSIHISVCEVCMTFVYSFWSTEVACIVGNFLLIVKGPNWLINSKYILGLFC